MTSESKKAYRRETYKWMKEHGYCVICQKERAFGKFSMCPSCLEKRAANSNAYRKKSAEKISQYAKNRRERLKAKGLCVQCGGWL